MHLPGEHAVNRFKLIIRNIPKARADDSGSDSQVIAAAIGRAINDGNGGDRRCKSAGRGWNSGLVQSAFSSLVNRGHGSFRALNGRKSYGKESRVATSRRHVGVTGSAGDRFDCANHLGSGGGLHKS